MYRWWTFSAGNGWIKLGPLTISWFFWFCDVNGGPAIEICWNNRLLRGWY